MLSLMRKDIYLLWKSIAFCMLYLVFMLLVFSGLDDATTVFTLCVFAIVHMLVMTGCALDDRNKSDIILNSMPLSRPAIVGARYLMFLVYAVFAAAFYIIAAWIAGNLNLISNVYNPGIEGILIALLVSSVSTGIYLPVYFKVGYIKSRIYSFLMFFVFFFIIGFFLPSSDLGGAELVNPRTLVSSSYARVTAACVSIAVLAASYGLSLKIYRNKEF